MGGTSTGPVGPLGATVRTLATDPRSRADATRVPPSHVAEPRAARDHHRDRRRGPADGLRARLHGLAELQRARLRQRRDTAPGHRTGQPFLFGRHRHPDRHRADLLLRPASAPTGLHPPVVVDARAVSRQRSARRNLCAREARVGQRDGPLPVGDRPCRGRPHVPQARGRTGRTAGAGRLAARVALRTRGLRAHDLGAHHGHPRDRRRAARR